MAKLTKKQKAMEGKVDSTRFYGVDEAISLVKSLATAKFDETIEAHFRLGIDPRKSDQNVRGTVALPHGTGKTVRVLAITQGDGTAAAEAAERRDEEDASAQASIEADPFVRTLMRDFDATIVPGSVRAQPRGHGPSTTGEQNA